MRLARLLGWLFAKCHKTGSQINSTEPMHKQTHRFLLRTELRKLAKWLQPMRRGGKSMQPARLSRECVSCASESVYGLALSGSHYGTFEYTRADSNGSGSTQGSKRRWSGPRKRMSDPAKEGWKEKEQRQKRRENQRAWPPPFLYYLPLLQMWS